MPLHVELGERVVQFELDRLQAGFVGDLFTGSVGDVEGVEDLVEVCGDLGQLDREFQSVNRSDESLSMVTRLGRFMTKYTGCRLECESWNDSPT